ncbi:MAG: S-layer homology domain-containing protein [Oscillospiraceae bacterium]|nr:S-layer homology domain-containing protein [Oscillospiraceae bacterium]
MKRKKFFAWVLTAALVLGMLPTPALAEAPEVTVDSGTTAWTDGNTYIVAGDVTISDRIVVSGTVTLQLASGTLTASKGIHVPKDASLTINGSGTLKATGDNWHAGIGGNENESGGNITINGGTINATGGQGAAGIGGGSGGYGNGGTNTIRITGGTVTAEGSTYGAGIGGGANTTNVGAIVIEGGVVEATGGNAAAGIGGGSSNNNFRTMVTITGGTIQAKGGHIIGGNGCVSIKIQNAVVNGTRVALDFTAPPQDKTVTAGEAAVFTVAASGEPVPTYQWQVSIDGGRNWSDISGATASTYTIAAADMSMNGWRYRCIISNEVGRAESSAATLTVTRGNLRGAAVTVSGSYSYTGQAIEPPVTVTLNGTMLREGTDYTVSYTNNVNIGTANVTVTGTGNYTGTANGTFTIDKATQAALSITGAPAAIYNGDSFTLTVSGGSGGGAVTWEIVSGPATVDGSGTVTVTGTGEIQIKAVKAADTNYTQAEAAITLNALTSSTLPPTQYLVTVNGGTGGGSYAEGATVTITATVPSGQQFTGWTVGEGGVTLANASSATTTFIMPAQAVTVTANFQNNSSSGGIGGNNGNSWYDTHTTYSVTTPAAATHGKVSVSPANAARGDTVTITVTPEDGCRLDNLSVTSGGKPVPLTEKGNGKYTFTMPAGTVKVEAAFVPVEVPEAPWTNSFTDIAEDAWYYDAVRFVNEQGLMSGHSDGRFGPNETLSRAQLAQILFNKEGGPMVNYLMDFSDVAGEAWYAEAVRWAASQRIVGGYGNGMFGPDDPITREQLAVMLWRYSGSPAATSKELHFADAGESSGYALEALRWAVEQGIINGYGNGQLAPQGLATRGQAAQMLMNFVQNR